MKALILTAALAISSAAFAQGAPLLLPAKEQTPAQKAYLEAKSRQEGVAKVTPVVIDANALNSNVISVTIGAKTYSFVGEREKASKDHETWSSTDRVSGNGMVLTRGPTGVLGHIRIDGVNYNVEAGYLIQNSPVTKTMTVADIKPAASAPKADPNKAGRTK